MLVIHLSRYSIATDPLMAHLPWDVLKKILCWQFSLNGKVGFRSQKMLTVKSYREPRFLKPGKHKPLSQPYSIHILRAHETGWHRGRIGETASDEERFPLTAGLNSSTGPIRSTVY